MQLRQGDVLIESISSIPKNAKKLPPENGAIVLAHGEATGHMHAIRSDRAALFMDTGSLPGGAAAVFLKVKGDHSGPLSGKLVEDRGKSFVADTDLGRVVFSKEHARIDGGEIITNADFSLLQHDEHTAHAVPTNNYRVTRQREYSPEAIRNVAD